MRKLFVSSLLASMALAGIAGAQVLNTTAITDQFTTGQRGPGATYDTDGTGPTAPGTTAYPPAAGSTDGTQYSLYQGADATPAGGIKYINSYASNASTVGDPTNGESPVVDVTGTVVHPDRNYNINTLTSVTALTANTRPGATSPNNVVLISDDGGQNALYFGDPASTDYYVQADVFCPDRSGVADVGAFEAAYVAVRAARDGAPTGGAYVIDRDPSYFMYYDYNLKEIRAVKAKAGAATADVGGRTGAGLAYDVQYGTTQTSITAGWHTFKVQAVGSTVTFFLDGTQFATATDGTPITNGRGALGYRERNVTNTNEFFGVFDNLQAGPASAAVDEWSVY